MRTTAEEFERDALNAGFFKVDGPVRYSAASPDCEMYVIRPWHDGEKTPLMVFIQGSGWTHPNPLWELPQLCRAAGKLNIAFAALIHRNCYDGHPFPAFLQDCKCAVRYLRAHADAYNIDPARVGVWGTSSGGNTALLMGVTGNDPVYVTNECMDQSDAVKLVVDCFGPSDMGKLMDFHKGTADQLAKALTGAADPEQVVFGMSPALRVRKGATYPPMLILGGDADTVVPFAQSEEMYGALKANGNEAYLVKVRGAEHEGSFWSERVLARILDFIGEKL